MLVGIILSIFSVAVILVILIRRRFFKAELRSALKSPEALQKFKNKYPPAALLRRSGQMEKLARLWGSTVVIETGLAPLWSARLMEKPRKKHMRQILRHCSEEAGFTAFMVSLKALRLKPLFTAWMEERGQEQVLRILARTCQGEAFDGIGGREMLGSQIDAIREMAGHPEWQTRFFAYQILLEDDDPASARLLWGAFQDPYGEIRKEMTIRFTSPERERLYEQLWRLVIGDPSQEVRFSAKERIRRDFADLYKPKYQELGRAATLRMLEHLDPDSFEDRDIAITYLKSSNLELRYPAARFLEKCGILKRLLLEAPLENKEGWKRNYALLKKAMEVKVSSFLTFLAPGASPGALYVGAKLLKDGGNRGVLTQLGEAVFQFFRDKELTPEWEDIYVLTLEGIQNRGEDTALKSLLEEVKRRRRDKPYLAKILPRIPERGDRLFLPLMEEFLKDPDFPLPVELETHMKTLPPDMIFPIIFDILNAPREDFPHGVRVFALKLLGKFKYPYFLQKLLEGFALLSPEDVRGFVPILKACPGKLFNERVGELLKSFDSRLRIALVTVLPLLDNRHFLGEIQASLGDPDPEMRIAAIRSLKEFGELKALKEETALLRDPIERVRLAAARVLGECGTAETLTALEESLEDPHETEPVKRAALEGLGHSKSSRSVKILGKALADRGNLHQEVLSALRWKKDRESLIGIIAFFQEASPELRDEAVKVFTPMDEAREGEILGLLETSEESLIPHIAQILEASGYTARIMRQLSDRDVDKRKTIVRRLALLKTQTAVRGLVLAARDPDQRVSAPAMGALGGAATPEERGILESLKQDPDRRIRKYTLWVLERVGASDRPEVSDQGGPPDLEINQEKAPPPLG